MNKQSVNKPKLIAALLSSAASYASVPVRSIQMSKPETQILDVGFPPPMSVAVANTWHINKYYYEATEDRWYVILNAHTEKKISKWVMRAVDAEEGRPIGEERFTSVDLWADRFADRPFDVSSSEVQETFDWFKNFVAGRDVVAQLEMFDSYEYRLRYCSSFDALVRLGLVTA